MLLVNYSNSINSQAILKKDSITKTTTADRAQFDSGSLTLENLRLSL
jgi:hypothetical protein